MLCYEPEFGVETDFRLLGHVAADYTLSINRLAKGCRNISDEVFPGIHLGDRYGTGNQ